MVILVLTIPYIINVYKTIGIGASPNRAVITSQQSHNIDNPSPVINCSSLVVDLPKNVSMNIHPSCPRHYLYKDGKRCPPVTSPADFIGVDYPFYFYGYSAFLMADEGNPQIAIIIMRTATKQNFKLGCYIQFAGSEEYIHGNMGPVYLTMSRFDTNKFGQLYSGIIRCLYPAGMQRNKVAQNIRIYTGNTTLTTLPVEELAKPLKRKSLGLCLARTYQDPYCKDCRGINYTYHLPEWVEMQRMMGVDTIFVYNVSMNADASLIFNYYARQGFVEVLSHTPIHNETYMPVSMGITECIYRNRYAYDYILAIDMDEFYYTYEMEHIPGNNYGSSQPVHHFITLDFQEDTSSLIIGLLTTTHSLTSKLWCIKDIIIQVSLKEENLLWIHVNVWWQQLMHVQWKRKHLMLIVEMPLCTITKGVHWEVVFGNKHARKVTIFSC